MNPVWTTILLAGFGTFVFRASFLVIADRLVDIPPWATRVLRQIPPAVLAALVVPALLRPEGTLDFWQPELLAGVIAGVVSWKTRNVGLTLVVGMVALIALQQLA